MPCTIGRGAWKRETAMISAFIEVFFVAAGSQLLLSNLGGNQETPPDTRYDMIPHNISCSYKAIRCYQAR